MLEIASSTTLRTVPGTSGAMALAREVPESGTLTLRPLGSDWRRPYFCYVPRRMLSEAPLLVCVHGITRNAWEMATRFIPYCERAGIAMIAPIYPKETNRRYQLLSPSRAGHGADEVLRQMVAEVRRTLELSASRICMFGYSGGAQFVHRYAFAYPDQVARYAIGAAGWYTLPDPEQPYPYGIAPAEHPGWRPMDSAAFLRTPARVLVGERDIALDAKLNLSERICRTQGTTRVDRAVHWIGSMRTAARSHGLGTALDLQVLPKAAHSFARCCDNGMADSVFQFLYGPELS